ncbi:MAG: hypothetical protein V4739_06960 [Pseudomonadota bacterium]
MSSPSLQVRLSPSAVSRKSLGRPARRAGIVLLAALSVAACGGGDPFFDDVFGGTTNENAPPPSSAVLVKKFSGSCVSSTCYVSKRVFMDENGEATVFWQEYPSGAASGATNLMAATRVAGAASLAVSGAVRSPYDTNPANTRIEPLSARRFAAFYLLATDNTRALASIVDLPAAGVPNATAPVALPSAALEVPRGTTVPLLSANVNQLWALVPNQPAPFPVVSLGREATLTLLTPSVEPFATVVSSQVSSLEAVTPTALSASVAQTQANGPVHAFVTTLSLTSGQLSAPVQISTQPLVLSNDRAACRATPAVQTRSGGAGTFATAFTRVNAAQTGCDLYVNNVRVNDVRRSVESFNFSTDQTGGTVAVWTEAETAVKGAASRIQWSRQDPTSLTFTTPAALTTEAAAGGNVALATVLQEGPRGTLAVSWQACTGNASNCRDARQWVSKFTQGAWTTTPGVNGIESLAVSRSGQAVALFKRSTCGSSNCQELYLLPF